MVPQPRHVQDVFCLKYHDLSNVGRGPRLRWRYQYFTPAEEYESAVDSLITPGCYWLDVGCGRELFPMNQALGPVLAARCALVVGVDPSENILENREIHERVQVPIEKYSTEHRFDVVTLQMVAEHVAEPREMLNVLAGLMRPGGRLVIYTVNRWSPVSIISWIVPFQLHHGVKKLFWQSEERDTFPVVYKMNTRRTLRRLCEEAGFEEEEFRYLPDCRVTARWPSVNRMELVLYRLLKALGLPYPETCLLGIYRRR